jgi:hypothetical protein
LFPSRSVAGRTWLRFCRERGLCRPYFFTWKKRLEKSAPTKFLEVQVTERAPSASSDGGVEIRLKNGRSLMVRPGFDAEHVRALLAVVEAAG